MSTFAISDRTLTRLDAAAVRLLDELPAMISAVSDLAESPCPTYEDNGGGSFCGLCDAWVANPADSLHEPDCIWVRARSICARLKAPPTPPAAANTQPPPDQPETPHSGPSPL